MHANRLKPYNLNMGIISDGQLVSVNTVKQHLYHGPSSYVMMMMMMFVQFFFSSLHYS